MGVVAICADSDEEALELASSSRMMLSLLKRGRLVPVPPVDTELRYLESRRRSYELLADELGLVEGGASRARAAR